MLADDEDSDDDLTGRLDHTAYHGKGWNFCRSAATDDPAAPGTPPQEEKSVAEPPAHAPDLPVPGCDACSLLTHLHVSAIYWGQCYVMQQQGTV